MRIIRFTSAVSCGILRPSQRAFGTYLCVYRKEDDHTTPDRKSSGWMILSAIVVAADRVPQPLSGSRTADSFFPSSCRPGQKKCVAANGHAATHFCMRSLYILLSAGDIHFSPHIIPLYSPLPVYRSFTASSYFFHIFPAPNTAASIVSSCAGPPIPPALPLHTPQRPRSSFASYVPSLVLYTYSCPSSRYTYSCPLPVPSQVGMQLESLPFERSFRLLYCFANGLPLPVDPDCIQCLMYEKLSCFR